MLSPCIGSLVTDCLPSVIGVDVKWCVSVILTCLEDIRTSAQSQVNSVETADV